MRRTAPALLILALALTGCAKSGAETGALTPAQAVRAAANTASDTSSRMDLITKTKVAGQDVELNGTGVFDYAKGAQVGEFTMSVAGQKVSERIVGGVMYLQLTGQPGFYRLPLIELAGTSFGQSSNPASSAQLLEAMGDDTKKVGTETLHGAKTTHYKGAISTAKAKELANGDLAKKSVQKLIDGGVTEIPADAYVDDQGRLRRLVENFTLTIKGTQANVSTQLDIYDFGVAVHVQQPPADQVKDGTQILQLIRSQAG